MPVSIGLDKGPTHGLPPPEFRESRMYEQDSKFTIGKTMPGDPPIME
jgi:hypothetical protein